MLQKRHRRHRTKHALQRDKRWHSFEGKGPKRLGAAFAWHRSERLHPETHEGIRAKRHEERTYTKPNVCRRQRDLTSDELGAVGADRQSSFRLQGWPFR